MENKDLIEMQLTSMLETKKSKGDSKEREKEIIKIGISKPKWNPKAIVL